MCTFLLKEWFKVVHPTFVKHYHFLKQMFACEQMRYPCRWHTLHLDCVRIRRNGRLGNVSYVFQIPNSQMPVFPHDTDRFHINSHDLTDWLSTRLLQSKTLPPFPLCLHLKNFRGKNGYQIQDIKMNSS